MARSLSNFINGIKKQGGFSYSNNYDVDFNFNTVNTSDLLTRFSSYGIDLLLGSSTGGDSGESEVGGVNSGSLLKMLCDEAQLPNVQAATGQITGRFLGEGLVNYPHTRLYSDFQLGWLGDGNLLPLKFLNLWYGYIFNEYEGSGRPILPRGESNGSLSDVKQGASSETAARTVRLNFPQEYLCNITITKTDRGPNAANERAPMSYTMIDAFPYSIDAVPLSYGASQITKITANFYYAKHIVTYNDVSI